MVLEVPTAATVPEIVFDASFAPYHEKRLDQRLQQLFSNFFGA